MIKEIYKTSGACAHEIHIEIEGDIIQKVTFIGGCKGNAQGVSALVQGQSVNSVVKLLKGIQCRNNTSCPDQLALALEGLSLQQAS